MTIDDTQATGVATELIRELRDALAGDALAPGDPGYDGARRLWNASSIATRPSLPDARVRPTFKRPSASPAATVLRR